MCHLCEAENNNSTEPYPLDEVSSFRRTPRRRLANNAARIFRSRQRQEQQQQSHRRTPSSSSSSPSASLFSLSSSSTIGSDVEYEEVLPVPLVRVSANSQPVDILVYFDVVRQVHEAQRQREREAEWDRRLRAEYEMFLNRKKRKHRMKKWKELLEKVAEMGREIGRAGAHGAREIKDFLARCAGSSRAPEVIVGLPPC